MAEHVPAGAQIAVAHPLRQHSHQLAAALAAHGLLFQYWTGLPRSRDEGLGRALLRLRPASFPSAALPPARVRVQPLGAMGAAADRLLPRRYRGYGSYAGDCAADRLYARWLRRQRGRIAMVIAYESAALETFGAARALGIRTVLDAASVHQDANDAWLSEGLPSGLLERLRRRKRLEIEAADHILVLSQLARDTFVRAGVDAARLSVLTPGFDRRIWRPSTRPAAAGAALRLCFVGNNAHRKGLDLLLQAFQRVRARHVDAELALVGDCDAGAPDPAGVRVCGKLSQAQIAELYANSDCLVLPSRCDGFGLVVAEALACGVPVIVSARVGARDLVRPGGNGWVVPADDAEALAQRLVACADDLTALRGMRAACAASVADRGWDAYAEEAVAIVGGLLARGAPR